MDDKPHLDKGPIRGEWQAKKLTVWRRVDGAEVCCSLPAGKRPWWARTADGDLLRADNGGRTRGKPIKGGGYMRALGACRSFATAAAAMDAFDKAHPLKTTATA